MVLGTASLRMARCCRSGENAFSVPDCHPDSLLSVFRSDGAAVTPPGQNAVNRRARTDVIWGDRTHDLVSSATPEGWNMRVGREVAAVATVVALGLGAAACSDDVPSTPASASSPATPGGVGAAASGTSASGGTVSTRCHTADLKADVQLQPDHPGSAMVMLTNKSSRTCTVHGYLGYGGLLADNSPVVTGSSRVPQPGHPIEVSLKPGVSAFSGLKWTSCDKADPTCKVLAGITITPPDETTQLTANLLGVEAEPVLQLTVSHAGFTVGSLQPVSQGVVFTS
ncbi:DUF4232 domain-containing protein [Kitasatospora sp. NPDC094028]